MINDVIVQEYETKMQRKEEASKPGEEKASAEGPKDAEEQLQNELNNEKEMREKFQAENVELESAIDKYKAQYETQIASLTAENEGLTSKVQTLESEKIELEGKLQGDESIIKSETEDTKEDQGEDVEKLRREVEELKEALKGSKDRFEKM